MSETPSGALAGVRVIDMTTIGMGPWATQMLGDMGADVIKVESADGDIFRHVTPQLHPGMSHAHLNFNRNKRSVVLDLKADAGRAAMLRLLAGADVFVSNVRPDALKRLGLDYASLKPAHPRLIYCGCYGFSEAGPYAGRASVDDVIQAACGLAWFQGATGGKTGADVEPRYVNTAVADKVCSLFVSNAIGMALYARERSGVGQAIEVPMFECMVSFVLPEHLAGLTFEPAQGPAGYSRLLDAFRKPFRTRDGYMGVVPYNDLQWRRFFELAGRPELAGDARFRTQTERSRHFTELYSMVEETLSHKTTAEWVLLLRQADIPFAPVNSVADLIADPHLNAIGFWHQVDHPTEGRLRMPGIPVSYSATPGSIRRHAPGIGEHTEEILRESRQDTPGATPR
jgi:crotonobetainyl-CoA:carnitine CoA-transferase CaiB-like acyl-CoA transferase